MIFCLAMKWYVCVLRSFFVFLCHFSLLVRRFFKDLLGPAPFVLELEVDGCGLHPATLKLEKEREGGTGYCPLI